MTKAGLIRVLRIIFLMLIVVFFCPFAYGKVIYVDEDAIGVNDGTSWQNAYTFLQDALADAEIADKPVEVRVAQGTYTPDENSASPDGTGRRKATFQLINNVTIIGGYAGFDEVDPNARDIEACETILSGDLSRNDIDVNDLGNLYDLPDRYDNSEIVVTGSNIDATAVLDGFTITGGYISVIPYGGSPAGGAGMLVSSGSPTLIDCKFSDNVTSNTGAGLLIYDDSNPKLLNCKFTRNNAESGGGIYSCRRSNPTLINCTFSDNHAQHKGGGMFNFGGNPILTNCTFSRNSIFQGYSGSDTVGGGMYNRNGNPVLTNCTFSENSASFAAGGMYNQDCNTVLNMCEFVRNTAPWYSGAVSNYGGQLIANGCVFKKNYPGAIEDGLETGTIFTECTFSGNSSSRSGGAVRVFEATFNHCIFTGNRVSGDHSTGGAVHSDLTATFNNCTFSNNWADSRRAIYCDDTAYVNNCIFWGSEDQIRANNFRQYQFVDYSDIQGGWTWPGEGNIDVDPCFVDPGYWANADDPNIAVEPNDPNAIWIDGDYHLKSQAGRWHPNSQSWVQDDVTSPCIDAGDPNSPIGHEPFPNGGNINMGAYGGTVEASKSPSGLHAIYGGGAGEPNDPYLIYTAEHLNAIGAEPNDWDKHFKLMADIDLAGYSYDQALIAPDVDTDEYYFQGNPYASIFDGNGHTISNLTITGVSYLGLFGELAFWSQVKDLGVVDVNISGSGDVAGGLSGHNRWGAVVIRCYSTGTVKGDDNIGGLVGSNGGLMRQCYSTSPVSGNYIVGGLLGANEAGAVVGQCYSTGVVNGDDAVAGLVGFNLGFVINCYSAGAVTGNQRLGGLVGWNYGNIVSNFWDIETSGQANMCGSQEEGASGCDDPFGLTTFEMQTAGTFLEARWDFVDETANGTKDIWWILEGRDYPRLWWELIE